MPAHLLAGRGSRTAWIFRLDPRRPAAHWPVCCFLGRPGSARHRACGQIRVEPAAIPGGGGIARTRRLCWQATLWPTLWPPQPSLLAAHRSSLAAERWDSLGAAVPADYAAMALARSPRLSAPLPPTSVWPAGLAWPRGSHAGSARSTRRGAPTPHPPLRGGGELSRPRLSRGLAPHPAAGTAAGARCGLGLGPDRASQALRAARRGGAVPQRWTREKRPIIIFSLPRERGNCSTPRRGRRERGSAPRPEQGKRARRRSTEFDGTVTASSSCDESAAVSATASPLTIQTGEASPPVCLSLTTRRTARPPGGQSLRADSGRSPEDGRGQACAALAGSRRTAGEVMSRRTAGGAA